MSINCNKLCRSSRCKFVRVRVLPIALLITTFHFCFLFCRLHTKGSSHLSVSAESLACRLGQRLELSLPSLMPLMRILIQWLSSLAMRLFFISPFWEENIRRMAWCFPLYLLLFSPHWATRLPSCDSRCLPGIEPQKHPPRHCSPSIGIVKTLISARSIYWLLSTTSAPVSMPTSPVAIEIMYCSTLSKKHSIIRQLSSLLTCRMLFMLRARMSLICLAPEWLAIDGLSVNVIWVTVNCSTVGTRVDIYGAEATRTVLSVVAINQIYCHSANWTFLFVPFIALCCGQWSSSASIVALSDIVYTFLIYYCSSI